MPDNRPISLGDRAPSRRVATVEDPPPNPTRAGGTMRDRVLLSPADLRANDPFITVIEQAIVAPGGFPTRPSGGFDRVMLVLEGALTHAREGDTIELEAGDVAWLSTGSGLLHGERSRGRDTCRYLEIWVNVPESARGRAPELQKLRADALPDAEVGPLWVRPIAGTVAGVTGPAQTRSSVDLWDIRVEEDGEVRLPLPASRRGFVLVLAGEVRLGARARVARAGSLAWLANEDVGGLRIQSPAGARFLVCVGEPIRQSVVAAGPFVAGSREALARALAEVKAGRFPGG